VHYDTVEHCYVVATNVSEKHIVSSFYLQHGGKKMLQNAALFLGMRKATPKQSKRIDNYAVVFNITRSYSSRLWLEFWAGDTTARGIFLIFCPPDQDIISKLGTGR
jgi:hypothetical protein